MAVPPTHCCANHPLVCLQVPNQPSAAAAPGARDCGGAPAAAHLPPVSASVAACISQSLSGGMAAWWDAIHERVRNSALRGCVSLSHPLFVCFQMPSHASAAALSARGCGATAPAQPPVSVSVAACISQSRPDGMAAWWDAINERVHNCALRRCSCLCAIHCLSISRCQATPPPPPSPPSPGGYAFSRCLHCPIRPAAQP